MAGPPPARAALVVALLALALLVVGGVGVVLLRTTGVGTGGLGGAADRLEDWIGAQVVGIANSYLVPQIAYDGLDYEAPGTVVLGGVRFTSPEGAEVFRVRTLTITLAEIPTIGAPLQIERLALDQPVVSLVREVGAAGAGRFRGLSPLVKNAPTRDADVESAFRLSNVLHLRRIDITDGSVLYDQGDGGPPMRFAGLTTSVEAAPRAGEPGWYGLDIASAAGALGNFSLRGLLSLDTFVARVEEFRLLGELSAESAAVLPPDIQALVSEYDARGRVDLIASGEIPLTDPLTGAVRATLQLRDFRIASGDLQLPIDALDAEASLGSGIATLHALHADLLQGTFDAYGDIEVFASESPARLSWTIEGVELRDLLRAAAAAGEQTRLAGRMNGSGSLTTLLASGRESLAGSGELHVRRGRLLILPGAEQLAQLMSISTARALSGEPKTDADVVFDVRPEGAYITKGSARSDLIALRGTGLVGFDGTLDLTLNGGPLEKVQSLLGVVGDAVGAVTDTLVKYRLTGTFAEPRVTVDPLGLGG